MRAGDSLFSSSVQMLEKLYAQDDIEPPPIENERRTYYSRDSDTDSQKENENENESENESDDEW